MIMMWSPITKIMYCPLVSKPLGTIWSGLETSPSFATNNSKPMPQTSKVYRQHMREKPHRFLCSSFSIRRLRLSLVLHQIKMIGSFPLMGWGKRSRKQKIEGVFSAAKCLYFHYSVLISHYCREGGGGPIKRREPLLLQLM